MDTESDLGEIQKINTQALKYRVGPSPIEDENYFSGENKQEDDSPKGLDIFVGEGHTFDIQNQAGSHVLLTYLATREKSVNLNYLLTVIRSGADLNYADSHGQTLMHQAALFWPTALADFFFKYGADVNKADKYGRTPVHVASAVNRADVLRWLIKHGGIITLTTIQEGQTPIHFASKYNATEAIQELFASGARLDDRDHKERTPLQLAAENGRVEACRTLIDLGAPVGVFDDSGIACITHMINKTPDVALIGLDQFIKVDKGSQTEQYYLSYLDSEKWRIMKGRDETGTREVKHQKALEAIVAKQDTDLIMHPVIQRLLKKKLEQFGRWAFIWDLLINLVFTIIWSALTVSLPSPKDLSTGKHVKFYTPIDEKAWIIVFEALGIFLALLFVAKGQLDSNRLRRYFEAVKTSRLHEISRDTTYCHPRWPQELNLLEDEKRVTREMTSTSIYDVWYFTDMLTYCGIVILMVTRLVVVLSDYNTDAYNTSIDIHYKTYSFYVLVVWLRLMKVCRPFITLGPFIAILGYVVKDTVKFVFLFCEFYIPYVAVIWIIFGKNIEPLKGIDDVLFNLLRMTMADSFIYGDMVEYNEVAAQIVCGTYFAIVTITCLNLYIALLSETFTRVFENATATAYLLQAQALVNIENKMGKLKRARYSTEIAETCSPETILGLSEQEEKDANILWSLKELQRTCSLLKKAQDETKATVANLQAQTTAMLEKQSTLIRDLHRSLSEITND